MSDSRGKYRIPVYVEGDTVTFYHDDGGKLRHTSNLADAGFPPVFISINNEIHTNKVYLNGLVDRVVLKDELVAAYPADPQLKRVADKMRDAFYAQYDQVPEYIRAIASLYGTQAIIAGEGNTIKNICGLYESSRGEQHPGKLLFTAEGARRYGTVLEEVSHLVDEWICERPDAPRFSESSRWEAAVKQDLNRPNALAMNLYRNYHRDSKKINTAYNLSRNDYDRGVEALVDVMRIEHSLIERMKKEGNLTSISDEICPSDTIDNIMNEALPNLWKLYRGPQEGMQLARKKGSGVITELPLGNKPEPGWLKVISFTEACRKILDGMGVKVEPPALPAPYSDKRMPVVLLPEEANRLTSFSGKRDGGHGRF